MESDLLANMLSMNTRSAVFTIFPKTRMKPYVEQVRLLRLFKDRN